MPEQYRDTKMFIVCNDCAARSCVPYHWLGNKCTTCGSYNTNDLKMANEPNDEGSEGRQRDMEEAQRRSSTNLVAQGAISNNLPSTADRGRSPLPEPIAMSADSSMDGRSQTPHAASQLQELHHSVNNQVISEQPGVQQNLDASERFGVHTDESWGADEGNTSDAVTEEEGDDAAFWGEGISPPAWNLPSGGWVSPQLLARATSSEGETAESASPSSTSWRIDPRHWRLGSPNFFSRSDEHVDDLQPHAPTRGRTSAREEPSWIANANAGTWAIDPRQWRLSSPSFFSGTNNVPRNQRGDDNEALPSEDDDDNKSPVRRWINSRFIAAGFGGVSHDEAVEDSDEGDDEDEQSAYGSDTEGDDDDDIDAEADGDEALDEMELQLPGHR